MVKLYSTPCIMDQYSILSYFQNVLYFRFISSSDPVFQITLLELLLIARSHKKSWRNHAGSQSPKFTQALFTLICFPLFVLLEPIDCLLFDLVTFFLTTLTVIELDSFYSAFHYKTYKVNVHVVSPMFSLSIHELYSSTRR